MTAEEVCEPDRRRVLVAAAGAILMSLTACQSTLPMGEGVRQSRAAAARVAAIRKEQGLSVLRQDGGLETAALRQATFMAQTGAMEHRTRRGRDFVSRMKDVKTGGTAAENIARGRFDVDKVLTVWMNSPPHRRNMLDERFSRFGLAYVADGKNPAVRYWAMVLAR